MSLVITTALKKIHKLHSKKNRHRVIQGGTSAGKTYAIVFWLANYCMNKPRATVRAVAETIPAVKAGALKIFIEIMEKGGRYNPNALKASSREESGITYLFDNGAKIKFVAYDTVGKAKAAGKFDVTFLNECNHIPFQIADALIIRTNNFILYDFNPDRKFWVHEEIIPKENAVFLLLKYTDNEACPEEIVKELIQRQEKAKTSEYWRNWCRVYVDGEVGRLQGVVFENWSVIDTIPEDALLMSYGMDFGFSPDPNAAVSLYRYNDCVIVDELLYQRDQTALDLCQVSKDLFGTGHRVACDSSQPAIRKLLRQYNVNAVKCGKKDVRGRIAKLQMIKILITRRSKNLIEELENYIWNEDGGLPKGEDHLIDAMGYGYDRFTA